MARRLGTTEDSPLLEEGVLDRSTGEVEASGEAEPARADANERAGRARAFRPTLAAGLGESPALIEHQEHVVNVQQMRLATAVGLPTWLAFLVFDWLMGETMYPGVFAELATTRIAVGCVALVCTVRLHRHPLPTPRMLAWLGVGYFLLGAVGLAIMAAAVGGLWSPYIAGVVGIIVSRGTFAIQPWRSAIVPVFSIVVVHFAALLAAVGLSAQREQFLDGAAWGQLALQASYALVTAAFVTLSSHRAWELRRRVFEQRAIGRYRLVEKLGSGGFGEVWTARQEGLRREVAVKLLRTERLHDLNAVRRFEREVRATTELSHPNTVRVFDWGVTEDGIWYYVMEKLHGVDLARLIEVEGPLAPERAVHLMMQACSALMEAHARGIVHRDLKPANIFITRAGSDSDLVKLLDFGVAKLAEHEDVTLTKAGRLLGTPAFMAPEVCLGKAADARSDIYSLGAVLYFILTGTEPFPAEQVVTVMLMHASTAVERPSERLGRPLPAALEAVVLRTLAKDPEQRFADAASLREALAACRSGGTWTAPLHVVARRDEPPAAAAPVLHAGRSARTNPLIVP